MSERSFLDTVRAHLRGFLAEYGDSLQSATAKQTHLHEELESLRAKIRAVMPDNPAGSGYKIYSQTDEDGIIAEIFRRIGDGGRTLVEIGCGNGRENNTHALLLQGWRGAWIEGSRARVAQIGKTIPLESPRLVVHCAYVTRENAAAFVTSTLTRFATAELDLLSIDIDGNDLYVLEAILGETKPRLVIMEYNAKFPPPMSITIAYNAAHAWSGDDYHGASLQALVNACSGYRLVACNLTGANAFFVRNDLAGPFADYPIEKIYQPARHHLIAARFGEPASLKFLRDALRQ